MLNDNFDFVTPCGECCTGCKKKDSEWCQGCIESDGNCKEWTQSGGCPIFMCAKQHNVIFCGLCTEFPCAFLVETVTWNPNIIQRQIQLTQLYGRRK